MARPVRVLVAGYYGHGNAGDEIVLAGIRTVLLETAGSRAFELRAVSGSPADTQSQHGLKSYPKLSPVSLLRALAWSDCLVLGGGSLIQDATSRRSALYYLWLARLAQALGRRVFAWAQGFGPLKDPGLRRMSARVLSRATGVTVRDPSSLHELSILGVRDACLSADPAFLARPADCLPPDTISASAAGARLLGVAARSWKEAGDLPSALSAACAQVAAGGALVPLYVPFQQPDDVALSRLLAETAGPPGGVLETRLGPEEMVRLFVGLDLVLGVRLHALILAARAGVPFAGVSYDPKVDAFCSAAGMPCVPAHSAEARELAEVLEDLRIRRQQLSQGLRQFAESQERQARESATLFWECMARAGGAGNE